MKGWAVATICVLIGCGGAQVSRSAGSVVAPASLGALPDPGIPREDFTAHMQLGWSLAASSTLVEMPPLPQHHDAMTLQAWAQISLGHWLHEKAAALAAAARELDLAAEEDSVQRVIGGAIVGLIFEHAAAALLSLPTPTDLDDEPIIADVYRSIVAFNAAPYLEHARAAYRACAANAYIHEEEVGPNWARFCAGRLTRLPRPHDTTVGIDTSVPQNSNRPAGEERIFDVPQN